MTAQQEVLDPAVKAEVVDALEQIEGVEVGEVPSPEVLAERVAALEAELAGAGQTMIEFKAKVRSEAMRMAEEHSLCAVVEQTLERIGINNVRVRVEVVQTTEQVRVVDLPEDLFNSLTEAQLAAYLINNQTPANRRAREFSPIRAIRNDNRNIGDPVINVITPEQAERFGAPLGHIAAFVDNDGRVQHWINLQDRPARGEADGTNRLRHLNGWAAICGQTSYGWRTQSLRDRGRVCRRCQERGARLPR